MQAILRPQASGKSRPVSLTARAAAGLLAVFFAFAPTVQADVRASVCSPFLAVLSRVIGHHSIYELDGSPELIAARLPGLLTVAAPKSAKMKAWRAILNPETIAWLRGQIAQDFQVVSSVAGQDYSYIMPLQKRFNFVIHDTGMAIAPVDIYIRPIDDVLSKHVVLAGVAPYVRDAGEMWRTADGVIHFNRASGSFKPSAEIQAAAAEIIANIFGVAPDRVRFEETTFPAGTPQ